MYTASDAIEFLLDSVGGGSQDQSHRVLRQAVYHAYRDLVTARDWRWYETTEEYALSPVPIIGTVTTLSDLSQIPGPQVGDTYLVAVNNRRYQWKGTEWRDIGPEGYYELVLPWGVQSVDSIVIDESGLDVMASYLAPRDFTRLYGSSYYSSSTPGAWTVDRSPTAVDRYRIRLLSGDAAGTSGTLTYRRRPRDLRYTGYEPASRSGTASWSANSSSVTGTGTQFTRLMAGAIVRINGDTSFHPEGITGLHPYTDEAVISSVTDSQGLSVISPIGENSSYSASKYIVTDALDISPGMYSAMLSGAELWTQRLLGKGIEQAFAIYQRDLRLAFESDAVAVISGGDRKHGRYEQYGSGGGLWWLYLRPGEDGGVDGECGIEGGDADTQFTDCGGAA